MTAVLFLSLCAAAAAQEPGLTLSIRFFDQIVYYPESDIFIRIALHNPTSRDARFMLADKRPFNVRFEVRNARNQSLRQAQAFLATRTGSAPVLFREVLIAPGEEFAFTVNLKEFIEISESGMYEVRAFFFPQLDRGAASPVIRSNILRLSIRPSVSGFQEHKDRIDALTGEILAAQPLPPDEVVAYIIRARQQQQWNRFFLYLDLESLFRRGVGDARFANMSQQERAAALRRYRELLMANRVDEDIVTIPTSFEILKTSYTPTRATVDVLQRFRQDGFTVVKQYTYYLHRRDAIWIVYDYTVVNMGTE